jgi:hypothetical protein
MCSDSTVITLKMLRPRRFDMSTAASPSDSKLLGLPEELLSLIIHNVLDDLDKNDLDSGHEEVQEQQRCLSQTCKVSTTCLTLCV